MQYLHQHYNSFSVYDLFLMIDIVFFLDHEYWNLVFL
jgi:hypothetical protein